MGYFYSQDALDPTAVGGISNAISAAFGQTFKITPIQLVRAVSAVVNGGYLLEPYVVGEIVDDEGNVVQKNERTVIRQVISEETSATMRELMEAVVTTAGTQNQLAENILADIVGAEPMLCTGFLIGAEHLIHMKRHKVFCKYGDQNEK